MGLLGQSTDKTLEQINNEEVLRQLPVIVYLILIVLTGTFGNGLVFYIYKSKYGQSNCRTFVLCLSVFDLISCLFVIPVEIFILFKDYVFVWPRTCKASVFLNTWPTLSAGMVLLCIAFDRYRKVCQPFQWQISRKVAILMCVMVSMIGVAFSWISPVIYGIQMASHPIYNVTIYQCVVLDKMNQTVFPVLNNVFFAILFVGALTGIIVMYCLIAVRVRKHIKKKGRKHATDLKCAKDKADAREMTIKSGQVVVNSNRPKYLQEDPESSDGIFCSTTENSKPNERLSCQGPQQSPVVCTTDERNVTKDDITSMNRQSVLSRMLSVVTTSSLLSKSASLARNGNGVNTLKSRDRKRKSKQEKTNRTAFIMFQISLAFIVSYLPLLCILLIRSTDTNFVHSLTNSGRTAYKFFLRSYYLNCALNPIIYGLWDSRFRKYSKQLAYKITCRNSQ